MITGDVKKLNPVISPIEMKEAISDWLSKEKVPEECDVRMLSDYLQQLMKNGQFESINFVVDHFQK